MYFMFDGHYFIVFSDEIKYEVQKDLWDRLKKLKENEARQA